MKPVVSIVILVLTAVAVWLAFTVQLGHRDVVESDGPAGSLGASARAERPDVADPVARFEADSSAGARVLVSGRVLDENGRPLADALVSVVVVDVVVATATSGVDGAFEAVGLDPSPSGAELRAAKDGFLPGSAVFRSGDDHVIVLRRQTTLELSVVSANDERPIAGALLEADVGEFEPAARVGFTDEEGRVVVDLPSRTLTLEVSHAAYETTRVPGLFGDRSRDRRVIAMEPAATVWIAVVDERGAPVAEPSFSLIPPGLLERPTPPVGVEYHPGPPASWSLRAPSPRAVAVGARHRASVQVDADLARGSTAADPAVVRLPPGAVVMGEVQIDGRPAAAVADVRCVRSPPDVSLGDAWRRVTVEAGDLRIAGLATDATYELVVRGGDDLVVERDVVIELHQSTVRLGVLELDAEPRAALVVEVRDEEDRPVVGADVEARGLSGLDAPPLRGTTDPSGQVSFATVAGAIDVVVRADGYCLVHRRVVAPITERVNVSRGAVLGGRVVDDAGSPVPFARVAAMPVGESEHPLRREFAQADEQGRFRFGSMCSGEVTLLAGMAGYLESAPRTVATTDDVRLVLPRAASLEVEVRVGGGLAPSEPWTFELSRDGISARGTSCPAGSPIGHATAPAGDYDVRVTVDGWPSVVRSTRLLPMEQTRLRVDVDAGHEVTLRTLAPDGSAAPHIDLAVVSEEARVGLESAFVTTGAAGEAVVRLAPGAYRVVSWSSDWTVDSAQDRMVVSSPATVVVALVR